jgi:CRISPR-associated protein Cmr3
MSEWIIEPRDPLIARDGRPAAAVNHFATVPFPYPSVLAGVVRTRIASVNGAFTLSSPQELAELRAEVRVRGPLLAELAEDDGIVQWLPPAPRDAVLLKKDEDGPVSLKRLLPFQLQEGETIGPIPKPGLLPLGVAGKADLGKPPQDLPAFWHWKEFETWLTKAEDRSEVGLASLGIKRLPTETRVHLAIQPGERVGIDGMLFQTSGLRFLHEGKKDSPLSPRRFALSVGVEGGKVGGRELALHEQIAPLGGERRLAHWRPSPQAWPGLPESIKKEIIAKRRARLILLTPAVFAGGALPGWDGGAWPLGGSVTAHVQAACVPRPEIVSGWNLETGQAKPTRRLACAGSVYFLELEGGSGLDLGRWCDETWFRCVSDEAQDRLDGFGMAALGTWGESS